MKIKPYTQAKGVKVTSKVLKSTRQMRFVRREVIDTEHKNEIRDYFWHEKAQIMLCRVMWRYTSGDELRQFTHWECPSFGGGNAGIGYWLREAKNRPHRQIFKM